MEFLKEIGLNLRCVDKLDNNRSDTQNVTSPFIASKSNIEILN